MIRRYALLLATLLIASGLLSSAALTQPVRVVYREAADAFEILDHVSNWWPGYNEPRYQQFWADSVRAQPGDSIQFARYAALREKYYAKRGQGNSQPRRDGSGLFTDLLVMQADPLAAAFYEAESIPEAIASLGTLVTADEQAFLKDFYAHFHSRIAPLLRQTRERTAASRAATASTLEAPEVAQYLTQVRRWFGVERVPFTALYVWWPDSLRTSANPHGVHLVLRVRPAAADTVNNADVVAHEIMHVYAATMDTARQRTISAALLDGCAVPAGVRRLAVLEEPITTVLGNMEFRRRFTPRRFQWSRQWYGDDWVDLVARLLYPVITSALRDDTLMGAEFARDATAMCALAVRARGPHSP